MFISALIDPGHIAAQRIFVFFERNHLGERHACSRIDDHESIYG